jgi:hypothetical protein
LKNQPRRFPQVETFYDYSQPDGGWTEGRLASPGSVSRIDWWPRGPQNLGRNIAGSRFVGVTAAGQVVPLATVQHAPSSVSWQYLNVSSSGIALQEQEPLVAVKWLGANGSFGNIAEIKLFAACSADHARPGEGVSAGIGAGYVPSQCNAFANRAGEFCPSIGLARQCGSRHHGAAANCSDPSRGGLTRGLDCAEAPGQRRTVPSKGHACSQGQYCNGGSKCPQSGNCPSYNKTLAPCDGSDGLLDTLYCMCSSTQWNGGEFRPGTTCAAHATADGTIRRPRRGGGWRLDGVAGAPNDDN